MSQQFFTAKKPAAVLKHEILRRYLPVYVGKTGSTSKGKRVAYIDAYAGPGTYDDGSMGSPAVAVETATQVRGAHDRIDGYFIEKDTASAAALGDYIAGEGLTWPVVEGEVQEELPKLLAEIDPATSLFVFLDPFGLGVPLDLVGKILERSGELKYGYRTEGAATEVLLNFSFPGLRRNAGHLESDKVGGGYTKARQTFINKLDVTMGGDWWQEIWESKDPEREKLVLDGYLARLANLPGKYGWWCVPVSNKWRGDPVYCLVQLSQHRDGHWEFHEALSNAMEPYRQVCMQGALDFEPLEERERRWVAEITANLQTLLAEGKSFNIQDRMREIFGSAVGSARTKHVRAAIKALYKAGETSTDGKGNIQRMYLKPPA